MRGIPGDFRELHASKDWLVEEQGARWVRGRSISTRGNFDEWMLCSRSICEPSSLGCNWKIKVSKRVVYSEVNSGKFN